MTKRIVVVMAIILFIFSATCYSQGPSVVLKTSALGAGVELENSFTDSIGARIGANYFSYDYDGEEDDIDYEFDVTLMSALAAIDWHPFKGKFRISAGAIYNGNEVEGTAKSSATYVVGDATYNASQVGTFKAEIEYNDFAPFLGFGWDTTYGKKKSGFGFLFEVGAIYQGSPDIDLSANGSLSNNATFQSNLQKEEDNLQDDLDDYKVYPFVTIGIIYRF